MESTDRRAGYGVSVSAWIATSQRAALGLVALVTLLAAPSEARSEAFPSRDLRIVVPFAPGGAADLASRVLAEKMRDVFKRPVIVENLPGAGGNRGTSVVAASEPDGHMLLMGSPASTIAVSLYPRLPYHFGRDFVGIAHVADVPGVLVVNPSTPATNVRELIDYLKGLSGAANYGSPGTGTSLHLAGELFKRAAGVEMAHVPYRGAALALTDLIGGRIQVVFPAGAVAEPFVQAGTLRALAITTGKRSSLWPDLPTVAESGLPGFEVGAWIGLFAPAMTPPEVVARLQAVVGEILARPDMRKALVSLRLEPVEGGTPAQFAALIRSELEVWAAVIKDLDIKVK